MNMLEEIRAEQAQVRNEINSVAENLQTMACASVEKRTTCQPMAVAIVDADTLYITLDWRNDFEKNKIFTALNTDLAERGAAATALIYPGTVSKRDDPSTKTPAVILILHTRDWKEMRIMTYDTQPDGSIVWHEPLVIDEFVSHLLSVPYEE